MGRKALKILGIIQVVMSVITIIFAIVLMSGNLPEINNELLKVYNAQGQEGLEWLPSATLIITGLLDLVMAWLLFRAAKDPNKSTLLLVLTILSIISTVIDAIQRFDSSLILSFVIDVIIVFSLFSAKKEENA